MTNIRRRNSIITGKNSIIALLFLVLLVIATLLYRNKNKLLSTVIGGAWVLQKYNGQEYPGNNSFELVSTDKGQTWKFNPITYN